MADPERYYALIARQRKKLDYAPVIEASFHKAVTELGPNPSLTELSRWLTNRVKPSASSKDGAKWTAQTVKDWLYFDGIDPSEANLQSFWEDDYRRNKSQRSKWLREAGFRFTAFEVWEKTKRTIAVVEGDERAEFQERKLTEHFERISEVTKTLRAALRIPRRD